MTTAKVDRTCENEWCGHMVDAESGVCRRCADEADHVHNMGVVASELTACVSTALEAVEGARRQVEELTGPGGHIEYEGDTDLAHWLTDARRALTAVAAVNQNRRATL